MPTKKQTLAEKARRQTAAGRRHVARKQAAAREQEQSADVKLQQEMRERAKGLFAEARREIRKAAKEGQTEASVTVMQWDRESHPSWCRYLSQYTKELLENEGLRVEVTSSREDPFGSDPMFYHTVYSVYLQINWDKPKSKGR